MSRRYALITPCRDEEEYARRTLDSVTQQSIPPALWVIVDDGSALAGLERDLPLIGEDPVQRGERVICVELEGEISGRLQRDVGHGVPPCWPPGLSVRARTPARFRS